MNKLHFQKISDDIVLALRDNRIIAKIERAYWAKTRWQIEYADGRKYISADGYDTFSFTIAKVEASKIIL